MSARVVCEIENTINKMLKTRFEERPYRRMAVGGEGLATVPRLIVEVASMPGPEGGDASLALWECRITITPPCRYPRQGIEAALEVIDLLHDADLNSEGIVIIDVTFREASLSPNNDARAEGMIGLVFDVSTVENDDIDTPSVRAAEFVT